MRLERRRRKWYVIKAIPPSLKEHFGGKARLVKSCDTEDKAKAWIRGAEIMREWAMELERAKQFEASGTHPIDALFWQEDPEGKFTSDKPWSVNSHQGQESKAVNERTNFALDDWVATLVHDAEKTKHMKRTTIGQFAKLYPKLAGIDRPKVQEWVDQQIAGGKSVATIRRSLSELRGYWSYVTARGAISEDNRPFERLNLPKAKGAASQKRQAFSPNEVVELIKLAEAGGDSQLADLIRVAAFTGARLEEICSIALPEIDHDRIVVLGTKTDAAARQVPIHADLRPTLARMTDGRKEGYLFDGLMNNKFEDRGNALGKRFGRLKTDAGHGPEKVFHSIRATFQTALWSQGVQRELISQIVGHQTGSITTDVYAKDPEFTAKKRAVFKLTFPGYRPI